MHKRKLKRQKLTVISSGIQAVAVNFLHIIIIMLVIVVVISCVNVSLFVCLFVFPSFSLLPQSTDTFSPATKGKGEGMGGCMASNEGGASGSGIYSGGSSFGATAVPTDYGGIYGAEDKKKKKKKGFF